MNKQKKTTSSRSYLLHAPAAGTGKSHRVASVIVGRHRCHAIVLVHVEGDALDGAGATERLVEVLAAEVVIYLQRLGRRGWR